MFLNIYLIITLSVLVSVPMLVNSIEFKEQITIAKQKTDEILKSIHARWKVDQYPNFLKSAAMAHTRWWWWY